jgi:ankyrin repeat protein
MLSADERLLLTAAKRGAPEVCEQLLSGTSTKSTHGSNGHTKSALKTKISSLSSSNSSDHNRTPVVIHTISSSKLLNVNVVCPATRKTPLLWAAEHGHVAVARVLLQHGANLLQGDAVGMTPLHTCAWQGDVPLATLLLKYSSSGSNSGSSKDDPLAAVHARNAIGQTPLHGAALYAHARLAHLLMDAGANPNARSLAGRLPLDELSLRNDRPAARLQIHQALLQGSPDTLYSVFFCKHEGADVDAWLAHMIRVLQRVDDCRLFGVMLRTAVTLTLVTAEQAVAWTEISLDACADLCVTQQDWTTWQRLMHQAHEEGAIRPAFYTALQTYRRATVAQTTHVAGDVRACLRAGLRLLEAGVDGKVSTTKACFLFYQQACTALAKEPDVKSPSDRATLRRTRHKIDALIGIVGTVLNAILLGRHSYDKAFRKLLQRTVDILQPAQLSECMARDFTGVARESLQSALAAGWSAGNESSKWMLDDAISREDGLVVLGICAGALGRGTAASTSSTPLLVSPIEGPHPTTILHNNNILPKTNSDGSGNDSHASEKSGKSRSSSSIHSRISQQTTLTIAKGVFREDSYLSREEEHLLVVHKAVKYCDTLLLPEAIRKAVEDGTLQAVDSSGRTALDLAALTGQTQAFGLITAAGGQRRYFKSERDLQQTVENRSRHVHIYRKLVHNKVKWKDTEDSTTADGTQSLSTGNE